MVKAYKIAMKGSDTTLEDYERSVPNYVEAEKERNRLRSTGEYVSISILKKT
jgi:hypothetical protein